MSQVAWEEIRARFGWQGPAAYLNTAAEGLWLRDADRALARYAEAKTRGALGRPALAEIETEARAAVARLLGGDAADIAFVSSTSRALDVAVSLADIAPGSNVVMLDSEFPSALVTGHRLRENGVELRLVPAIGTTAGEAELAARVDDATAAVIVSSVSFLTGRRVDIAALRALLGQGGPVLIVDGIQSTGLLELPLDAIDVLVFGTYKWLLGPHGLAVVHRNPRTMADREPAYRGWRGVADPFAGDRLERSLLHPDARRLEDGMPNYLGLAVLVESLAFLETLGTAARAERTAELTAALVAGLGARGIDAGPAEPDRRVGIVTIPMPDAEDVAARLAGQGFHVWGREGVLRVSPYIYNTVDELERLAAAIPEPGR
ncbi:MAG TPA: aminotransferase class V-fold PLP-dependent enzyme [Pseudolysinimonas sp.]|nr:aminotransferase class V-fold PLP-dependent enzyme [Pseudolysinimonas sp.]